MSFIIFLNLDIISLIDAVNFIDTINNIDVIEFLLTVFLDIIEILVVYYFFNRFLDKRILPIYYLLFALMEMLLLILCPSEGILEFIIYTLSFALSGIFIEKTKVMLSVLYAVITIEIMHLCYGILNSLLCIFYAFISLLYHPAIGYLLMGISSIFSLILSILCYIIIEKYFKSKELGKENYVLMLLTPALLIFLVSEYISQKIYGNTVTIDNNGKLLLNSNPFQILLIQCLGLGSLFCILYAYKKLTQNFQLNKQISLLEQEAHFLNQYVDETRIRFEKTRSFRHDINNHLFVIKELIQSAQPDTALQYIKEMYQFTEALSFPVNTNNPVLDILLENKLGIAAAKQIEVTCSLTVPCPCTIHDIDFCIILSNALDNAISACSRIDCQHIDCRYTNYKHTVQKTKKFIDITGKTQGSFFMLKISNSYIIDIGLHPSKISKGIGLSNIKATAEKYHGAMEIQTEGEIFTLSVLLIIPQQSDDISQQIH